MSATSDSESIPFPVVGVGASAGGLEAFAQLLKAINVNTGMAFVLVQHLDPNHESLLGELLSRSTTMPVVAVESGTAVKPNHVYVIPPNTSLTLTDGRLRLAPREKSEDGLYPIDHFFLSLARDQKDNAIGIILSGTGTDGAKGLAAIIAEGGLTFAQDKKSARFDGMPTAAVASGVDFVLSPEEIAAELHKLGKEPRSAAAPVLDQTSGFQNILKLLAASRSADFSGYKMPTVRRRILRRMSMHQIKKLDDYVVFLKAHATEVDSLYEDILIKVTEFFRTPDTFDSLKHHVIPMLQKRHPPPTSVRVWVPGCATGEEAYSIAICLMEALEKADLSIRIEIFATDISETALATARAGYYDETRVQNVSRERLKRFFVKEGRGYRVASTIREPCIFAKQNVARDPPFSKLDLVSCRNLLIYLSPALQERVLSAFHFALNAEGFLALGNAETIGNATELFDVVDKAGKIFVRKQAARSARAPNFAMDALAEKLPASAVGIGGRGENATKFDIRNDAEKAILAKHTPPGVVINDRMEVLQFRGDTRPYLLHPPGEVTASLFKMCAEGLLVELRSAIHEADGSGAPVKKTAWIRTSNHEPAPVSVDVVPFLASATNLRHFVVLFAPGVTSAASAAAPSPDEMTENRRLLRELGETKEYLNAIIEREQAANEELKSASEEILSSNEELQSTNEEMATAKEEVQATNEELTTVNEEVQGRFQELNRVNNDLTNLFGATNIPIVMLSEKLRIRRFTQSAERVLNFSEADVGKSLAEIAPKLRVSGLAALAAEVIESLNTKELEIQDSDGRWFSLRIKPYRTGDNRIDGAVIVLVDIDPLKRSFDQITEAHEYSEAIIETAPVPLLVLDGDLKVVTATEAFCRLFQVTLSEIRNAKIYELGKGSWNTPMLRALLEEILPKNERLENFIIDDEFPGLGRRVMRLNARRLVQKSDRAARILLAIDDVTEEKKSEARTTDAKDAAEAANQAKSDFLANMSHEIRTPLGAILGYSELLAGPEQTKADVLHCTARIQKNIEQLTELIDEILDISKIEAGKLEIDRVQFALLPELSDTFTLLQDRATARDLAFDVDFDGEIPESISACPMRLRQILLNIGGNALKFTAKGGVRITVSLAPSAPRALLTFVVSDTGCGLTSAQQDRIFQPFGQADSSVTRKFGGSGLGLILSRRLAELLGGDVALTQSRIGEGSTFTFTLDPGPLVGIPMLSGVSRESLKVRGDDPCDSFDASKRLAGLRILLVEDGPDNQILMTHFLTASGAIVASAENGAAAVKLCLANAYDLVVMDMQMPILDGYEATKQLRAKGCALPILALTANAMRGERDTCLSVGCDDYLSKPVKANLLVETVARLAKKKF